MSGTMLVPAHLLPLVMQTALDMEVVAAPIR
jgi:hypothetical protein